MQCRGQVDGPVIQGVGRALYEHVDQDARETFPRPACANNRIPACAAAPRSEALFADTCDAHEFEGATGARFQALPLTPARLFDRLLPMT